MTGRPRLWPPGREGVRRQPGLAVHGDLGQVEPPGDRGLRGCRPGAAAEGTDAEPDAAAGRRAPGPERGHGRPGQVLCPLEAATPEGPRGTRRPQGERRPLRALNGTWCRLTVAAGLFLSPRGARWRPPSEEPLPRAAECHSGPDWCRMVLRGCWPPSRHTQTQAEAQCPGQACLPLPGRRSPRLRPDTEE